MDLATIEQSPCWRLTRHMSFRSRPDYGRSRNHADVPQQSVCRLGTSWAQNLVGTGRWR
jgi:hypothetical protein